MGNKSPSKENPEPPDHLEEDDKPKTPEQMSYYTMIKQAYQELVNAIIRPPRCQYELQHLGPAIFEFCGKTFQRTDFEIRNPRGHKIVCSLWEPTSQYRPNPILPCVIYMHGNSSARVEALPQLSMVLSLGATLLSFDFSGSGLSEGDYVSLGAFEKDDLQAVIEHLRSTGTISTIALWGRSMGAATALLHGERDPSIAGMVLDSSFADLQMLAEEMVEKGRQHGLFAPSFAVKIAIRFIRSSILKTADFDIKVLSPIEHADKCYIPALFVAAEGDVFVPPHHSQKIYLKYAGDKNVIIVDGDHNSPRPKFLFDSAGVFLSHTLQVPEEWLLLEGQKFGGVLPWNVNRKKQRALAPAGASGASGSALSFDEALAMSLQESEVGMTSERQADVQAKLNRMMGAGLGATPTSSSASSSKVGAPPAQLRSGDAAPATSNPPHPPSPASALDADVALALAKSMSVSPQDAEVEWICDTCTLINEPQLLACSACGMPKQDDMF